MLVWVLVRVSVLVWVRARVRGWVRLQLRVLLLPAAGAAALVGAAGLTAAVPHPPGIYLHLHPAPCHVCLPPPFLVGKGLGRGVVRRPVKALGCHHDMLNCPLHGHF